MEASIDAGSGIRERITDYTTQPAFFCLKSADQNLFDCPASAEIKLTQTRPQRVVLTTPIAEIRKSMSPVT